MTNQLEGAKFEDLNEPVLETLFPVPWRIEMSKLLDRKFLRFLRFCSAVLVDLPSLEVDGSSPHLLISVAEEVNELRIEMRSVLEQMIPAACEDVEGFGGGGRGGIGISEALLLDVEADGMEASAKSENRRCCCV